MGFNHHEAEFVPSQLLQLPVKAFSLVNESAYEIIQILPLDTHSIGKPMQAVIAHVQFTPACIHLG